MPEENDALVRAMRVRSVAERAGRRYFSGQLGMRDVVLVASRWGKVAAASTATDLLATFDVREIVFFGIAGSLRDDLHPGDIVIAESLTQHDLDARPFFPRRQIPQLGVDAIPADPALSVSLADAARQFVRTGLRPASAAAGFPHLDLAAARVIRGDIASGDQVIFTAAQRDAVRQSAPNAVCVEMEGAAVAQVCYEHGVAFACVRTISDRADDDGAQSVQPFLNGLAGVYTRGIAEAWLGGF